uniref:ANK_REP_REGION domain-containing protein n=1 Tax=Elaeophora elaphi TaxID=1147741 RepID=A0A0R3S2Y4_9BILA
MDEIGNVVMEDNYRTGSHDDNEIMCPKENITQKNAMDVFRFETEDGYGFRADGTPKIAFKESDSSEHSVLAAKEHREVSTDSTCLHSEISKNENFGIDEFDATNQNVQENTRNDGSSTGSITELQSSSEISQNKVSSLLKFLSCMFFVGEITHDNPEIAETRSANAAKPPSQGSIDFVIPSVVLFPGQKHYIPPGWVYHGESDGYRYYIGCAGEVSVNVIVYHVLSVLFCRVEKFHFSYFIVNPSGVFSGLAIFPRDANNRFIFPSGPNGRPIAPVNIYGVPVMPLDEQGKPVVPYDASGTPLIHLASDGSFVIRVSLFFYHERFQLMFSLFSLRLVWATKNNNQRNAASVTIAARIASLQSCITPLTEEEYQYSLQWNDYYNHYYKNTPDQKISVSSQSVAQSTTTEDTYEQKAKNMKLLKKVRPEDIDLPPCVPPSPSIQPSSLISDVSVLSAEIEKKTTPDPALKAKTKKMIEMQLKFSRKKLRDTVNSSVAAVPSNETINISTERVSLPRQPSDSPENIDKIESPKERPPPPPMLVPTADPSLESAESDYVRIRESFNATRGGAPKSLNSQVIRKLKNSSDGPGMKKQVVMQAEPDSVIQNVSDSAAKTSSDITKKLENPKLFTDSCRDLTSGFQIDSQVFRKEVTSKLDGRISESEEITSRKQPELVLTDVAVRLDVISEKQPQDEGDIEEQKIATKTRSSDGSSCESKVENQMLRKRYSKNECISTSHEKRSEKKMRRCDGSKDRRKRRGENKQRRSRSGSSYRDSHRRSRSRGMKHRSRSRTPRDYYYRSRYRSRSRDRFYGREGSYYDRRTYRRYWTPDAEDRYSYRRRHSSSRDRSTSQDITPIADKSSRSRSYYEYSKSRTESPVVSRHSSVARSMSQYKTTDSRNRSSSRRNSPEYDISQRIECESEKSLLRLTEDLESVDSIVDAHKTTHRSASPRSEKSSVKELEVRTEKLKKHKKTKEKHRKRKKSHHRKKDKKKPSPFIAEIDEKYKTSSVEETDLNLNTSLSQLADEIETVPNAKKESNDYKNERMKKKKEKKKKKERRNTSMERNDVTKKVSRETLEDGEIITEKDMSPRAREKVVSYATSESEGENNNTGESKDPAEQLVENYNIKDVPPMTKFAVDSKVAEKSTKFKENFNNADIIRSSVLSFDFVDEVLKVPSGNTNMSKLEKKVKLSCEPINPKRETKITVDLEDDGISSKLKDLTSDFNEITAREAEKLKAGNITEAMNKLKELRGYVKSKVAVANLASETEVMKQFSKASGNDSTFAGHSLADVPLPKEMQGAVDVTERVEQTATSGVRTQEACTSAKIDLVDRDVRRKKELLKRKWEEDEEDELSRLRYEALRSKTRRLMNDLKAERRRLKRERLRAAIAMRRARERSVDASVDEILLADTSDSSETDDSEDYSPSHKVSFLSNYYTYVHVEC